MTKGYCDTCKYVIGYGDCDDLKCTLSGYLTGTMDKCEKHVQRGATNFDRIKDMTVEEMAEFMFDCNSSFPPCDGVCETDYCRSCGTDKCKKQVLSWLNQPL